VFVLCVFVCVSHHDSLRRRQFLSITLRTQVHINMCTYTRTYIVYAHTHTDTDTDTNTNTDMEADIETHTCTTAAAATAMAVSAADSFSAAICSRPNVSKDALQYTSQQTATHCNILQHTATHCMRRTASPLVCGPLKCVKKCNTLQHTATHIEKHCNTLQHTTTHCIRREPHRPWSAVRAECVLRCAAKKHCITVQQTAFVANRITGGLRSAEGDKRNEFKSNDTHAQAHTHTRTTYTYIYTHIYMCTWRSLPWR